MTAGISSMTGFARVEADAGGARLRWEIRSVNHRYLDLQLRLPDGLRGIEEDCRSIVKAGASRGKVDAALNISLDAAALPMPELNLERAKQVIKQAEQVGAEIEAAADLDPLKILRWPGVLREAQQEELDWLFPAAKEILAQTVDEFCAARRREGEKIQALLEGRCEEILERVAAVRERLPLVLEEIRKRLLERIQAVAQGTDPERLEQEIALVAQKLDVSEELERLEAHVAEVRSALEKDEAVGRRLDFLMQELNREANTLASKSADAETTRHAVDLKVIIEQMREQVQNVE